MSAIIDPRRRRGQVTRGMMATLVAGALAVTAGLGALRAAEPSSDGTASTQPEDVSLVAIGIAGGPYWNADGLPTVYDDSDLLGPPRGAPVTERRDRVIIFRFMGQDPSFPIILSDYADIKFIHNPADNLPVKHSRKDGAIDYEGSFQATSNVRSATFKVGTASGKWNVIAEGAAPFSSKTDRGVFVVGTVKSNYRPTDKPVDIWHVTFEYNFWKSQARLVAVDSTGHEHFADMNMVEKFGPLTQGIATFVHLWPADVKSIRVEMRPIHWTTFSQVPLNPTGGNPGDAWNAAQSNAAQSASPDSIYTQPSRVMKGSGSDKPQTSGPPTDGAFNLPSPQAVAVEKEATDASGKKVYYVMGAVDHPGVYDLHANLTLLQAVAAAGIRNPENLRVTVIRLQDGVEKMVMKRTFDTLSNTTSELSPNDVVVVRVIRHDDVAPHGAATPTH